jgi:CheY-like chemotaxis protein
VEDEPAVRTLARRALESAGYAVTEAEHGRQALELLSGSARLPDLVITDAIMPELNGRELCDALSKVHSQLPTLYMSGYTGADVVLRGLVPEGAALLQKPFTPDALIRQVEGLLAPSER